LYVSDYDIATGDCLSANLQKNIPSPDPNRCCSPARDDAGDDGTFRTLLYADAEQYRGLRRRGRGLCLHDGRDGQFKRRSGA
jgi:hypothetical protein